MGREAEVMTVGGGCSTARCLPLLLPGGHVRLHCVRLHSIRSARSCAPLGGRRICGGRLAAQDSALLAGIVEPGLESKPSALFPGSSSDGLLMELPGLFPRPRSVGLGIIPFVARPSASRAAFARSPPAQSAAAAARGAPPAVPSVPPASP